jgi:hypothetical protein
MHRAIARPQMRLKIAELLVEAMNTSLMLANVRAPRLCAPPLKGERRQLRSPQALLRGFSRMECNR